MQATNVKDKNGKHIFEMDIVRIIRKENYKDVVGGAVINSDLIGVVIFTDNGFYIKPWVPNGFEIPVSWIRLTEKVEVMGNVYENFDLLNDRYERNEKGGVQVET